MSPARGLRRAIVALLALVLAPLSVALSAPPVHADPTASVSGHVTNTAGDDLEDVLVSAYQDSGSGWQDTGVNTVTDADGLYTLTGLEAGTYRLEFFDCTCTYVGGFWTSGGLVATAAEGEDIELGDSETATADAQLVAYPRIAGTVTGPGGGPLEGMLVTVSTAGPSEVASAVTGASGEYEITGLQPDSYYVEFSDSTDSGYLSEWWNGNNQDGDVYEWAWPISLDYDDVEEVNATLVLGGHVTGTVTDVGLTAVEGIDVWAYAQDGGQWTQFRKAETGPDGAYDVDGLPNGDYRIGFEDPTGDHLPEYWDESDGVEEVEDASTITINGLNTVTDVDAALAAASHLTGVVTDGTTGIDLVLLGLSRRESDGGLDFVGNFRTQADGTFDIGGLRGGSYQLSFTDQSGSHVSEYWDDRAAAADADDIVVGAQTSTALPHDVVLAPASTISGVVTDEEGTPLEWIDVTAVLMDGDDATALGGSDWTNDDGELEIRGLPAGAYRLKFGDPLDAEYADEYWLDAATPEDALHVVVGADEDVVLTPAARLGTGASISGTVTGAAVDPEDPPTPQQSILVEAYEREDDGDGGYQWNYRDAVQTDADGEYSLTALPAGDYRVRFADPANVFLDQHWDHVSARDDATTIHLDASQALSGIDARLPRGARIGGTVLTPGPAFTPLEGVDVTLYVQDAGEPSGWRYLDATQTDADGEYTLIRLTGGTYTLEFDGGAIDHSTTFWDGRPTLAEADAITLADGEDRQGLETQLRTGASIAGRVTDAHAAADTPVPGIYVTLLGAAEPDAPYDEWDYVDAEQTDTDGNYSFHGLPPGHYRVQFNDIHTDVYRPQFWPGGATYDAGQAITLAADESRTGVDAAMARGARLSGTAEDSYGNAIDDEPVDLFAWNAESGAWESVGSTYTDDGDYTFVNLPAGTYTVRLSYESARYLTEWWDDRPDQASATPILLDLGDDETLDPAVLAEGSHLTGHVTTAGGDPIPVLMVRAYRWVDGDWGDVYTDFTNSNGDYDIDLLPPGTYAVRFGNNLTTPGGAAAYLEEYWDDEPSLDEADEIEVGVESSETADAELAYGGRILGTVNGDDGPLAGVRVRAWKPNGSGGWSQVRSTSTDASGAYVLDGLRTGTFRLELDAALAPSGHRSEWWQDTTTRDTASPVEVTVGEDTVLPAAQLSTGAHIQGVVRGADGLLLEGADVQAYRASDDAFAGSDTTGADGVYDIKGLDAGDYLLYFYDLNESGNLPEWWDDSLTRAGAVPITVGTDQTVSGKNAQLVAGAHITGTVLTDGGGGLQGITVGVWEHVDNAWELKRSLETGPGGGYDVDRLAPGSYRLQFVDQDGVYVAEFWDDAPDLDSASTITIDAARTPVSGISPELVTGARISGHVIDPAAADLEDVRVRAWAEDGDGHWSVVGTDWTDDDGDYAIYPLPAGTYRVQLDDFSGHDYRTEWYDDVETREDAEDLVLGAGEPATGIDAEMNALGVVTGTVTAVDDDPLSGIEVTAFFWHDEDGWTEDASATTDGNGDYELSDLSPGDHRVRFVAPSGGLLTEWYAADVAADAPTAEEGDDVAVALDTVTEDVDVEMSEGSHITGTIAEPDGTGLTNASATAYRLDTAEDDWEYWDVADTVTGGAYDLGNLPAGTYRLEFDDHGGDSYDTEYWDDEVDFDDATSIVVETESTVSGKNAQLTKEIEIDQEPSIEGDAIVGETLTADPGAWDPGLDLTFAYQWLRDGDPILGADDETYHLLAADLGEPISVEVTASRTGFRDGVATSDETGAVVNPSIANAALPTIAGTARVGSSLRAAPGSWTPPDGVAFHYQWFAGASPVGTALASYTPAAADVGKVISVRVTATRPGYQDGVATSAATAAVQAAEVIQPPPPPPPPPVPTPTITQVTKPTLVGKARLGATLKVTTGAWTPTGSMVTFQWYAGGKAIPKATKSKLKLSGATAKKVARKTITVVVTVTYPGAKSVTVTLKTAGKVKPPKKRR